MQRVEWQLDAVDLRPVEKWLQSRRAATDPAEADSTPRRSDPAGPPPAPSVAYQPQPKRTITETYYDTADWRLHRAGLTLGLRCDDGEHAVSLNRLEGVDRVGPQAEIEERLPGCEVESLLASDGRAGAWVRALVGGRPLLPLFTLDSTRQPYLILTGAEQVGAVTLDDTRIPLPEDREPTRINRVRVELDPDQVEVLRPYLEDLRAACRLTPAMTPEFEAGLLARGLIPQREPDLGSTTVLASHTVGELAFAMLRRQFMAFRKNEPAARIGEDDEALHDMRVAARRMRAAISLFSPALPAHTEPLREELRWIGGVLGEVRDADIQLERLAAWAQDADETQVASLQMLSRILEKHRQRARERLLRALDSRRYQRLVERFTSMLQRGPLRRSMNSRTPALALLPEMIAAHHARVVKLGDRLKPDSPPQAYHRLRIRCKRLRYAVEFSREAYGPPAVEFAEVMVGMQDLLGLHQDAYVAVGSLEELLGREARRLPPQAVFLMGQIAQRYMQEAARLRKRFPKAYRQVEGKSWVRLQQTMEASRPAAWPEATRPEATASEPTAGG